MTRGRLAAAVAMIVVVTAVILGLKLAGSPAAERDRRLDVRRAEDLAAVARAVDVYYARRDRLPAALEDLTGTVTIADPSSGRPYDFRPLGPKRYEVCATFSRQSEDRGYADFWTHGQGRQCFQLDVKPVSR